MEGAFVDLYCFVAYCVFQFQGGVLGIVLSTLVELDALEDHASCSEGCVVNVAVSYEMVAPS